MKSHITLKINGTDSALKPDASIEINDQNPIFNDTEMYTLPFELPFDGNRQFLKNVDARDSSIRPVELDNAKVVLYIDGLPFRSGYVVTEDKAKLKDSLPMSIDAKRRSLEDLIGDLECRDIPVKDRIVIGEKIGNVQVSVTYDQKLYAHFKRSGKSSSEERTLRSTITGLSPATAEFEPQALGFSYPAKCVEGAKHVAEKDTVRTYRTVTTEDYKGNDYTAGGDVVIPKIAQSYINVANPYPFPYCNARVAYAHTIQTEDRNGTRAVTPRESAAGSEKEAQYPFWVLDANRPQSGICFYVLYFLDCLFAHLGVAFDNSALRGITDLCNLTFFTTKCSYDTEVLYHGGAIYEDGEIVGYRPYFNSYEEINTWLSSRGCGGRLVLEDPEEKDIDHFDWVDADGNVRASIDRADWDELKLTATIKSSTVGANVLQMLANSGNFPEASVMDVINSLEASFGIRFSYDEEMNKVTAYLLRDIYRQQAEPRKLLGEVQSMAVVNDKTTGFKMLYSAESDKKEQLANIRDEVPDYDTSFDYIDYNNKNLVVGLTYLEICRKVSARNRNVYIDINTGNAYRIKIDSEYVNGGAANPRLFEVGQNKGVEIGDCSKENEDNIIEYSSSFTPVPFGDVNSIGNKVSQMLSSTYRVDTVDESGKPTTDYVTNVQGKTEPMMCVILSEEMEPAFVEKRVRNLVPGQMVDFYVSETLNLIESYDPTQTDDGNSPLQGIDWGLSIALMRGGGTDATIENFDYGYDGFNNAKWRIMPGTYAMSSDSLDILGNEFDYNGVDPGYGSGERFSLKICAYKPFRYKTVKGKIQVSTNPKEWENDPTWLIPCAADRRNLRGEIETKVASRGLYNTFMADHAYFFLHRKVFEVQALCTMAELIDIRNHWNQLWDIDGRIGLINKVNYSVTADKGVGVATIEFFA